MVPRFYKNSGEILCRISGEVMKKDPKMGQKTASEVWFQIGGHFSVHFCCKKGPFLMIVEKWSFWKKRVNCLPNLREFWSFPGVFREKGVFTLLWTGIWVTFWDLKRHFSVHFCCKTGPFWFIYVVKRVPIGSLLASMGFLLASIESLLDSMGLRFGSQFWSIFE